MPILCRLIEAVFFFRLSSTRTFDFVATVFFLAWHVPELLPINPKHAQSINRIALSVRLSDIDPFLISTNNV